MAISVSALFFSVLVFSAVRADEAHPTKDELLAKQDQLEMECSIKHNVPKSYFELLMLGEATESKNGKCFIKCGMNGMGYLNADGSLNEETIKRNTMTYFDDEETRQFAFNTWIECGNQCHSESFQDSSCDRAFELAKCFFNHIKETGIVNEKAGQPEESASSE